MNKTSLVILSCGIGFAGLGSLTIPVQGAVLRVGETSFRSDAGLITFSEFPLTTANPVYNPQDYGGMSTGVTVSFGGFFQGQSLGTDQTCPKGAALTGCVQGNPTGSLTLDAYSPQTFIVKDIDTPTSPVLSGYPIFNGAISILFSENVAAVGLTGGYFNSIGATAISAFGRDGSRLGFVSNTNQGIEFLGLVSGDGSNIIAGLQFSLIGPEPAGFAIDNLRFGKTTQVNLPFPTPSPQPSESPPPSISELVDHQNTPSVPVFPLDWRLLLGLGIWGSRRKLWWVK